ncbi:MAG: replication-associated recombination protein A [Bacteroidales bacterium]|nr:replication-associated recombination protein A [Bacteroidales bacterium]MBQ6742761.1 replication-associated recombination protein A [Bacteroidales bacterium]
MTPLAEILRPQTLDEYVGQSHLVGKGAVLRTLIESGRIPSMIFWGPPGTGKTTLAGIIANQLARPFHTLSAISSGVKEVREVIEKAQSEEGAILFIDEIHRFNKSQQDSLLGAVERGVITLIGATTENPSFEVISALLSRCQVYVLKDFGEEEMNDLLDRAVKHYASQGRTVLLKERDALMRISGGDGRKLLNALELVVSKDQAPVVEIDNRKVTDTIQQNLAYYDKQGEMHYDIISAFIKSMRGSDPNGAVYWLARMIEGGEDPLFIARRMLIFASEDISNANPNALLLANACFEAVSKIGYPECRITLSQCAVYLACSVKSNSTYMALNEAQSAVRRFGDLPVPLHIRNAPTKLMKQMGYSDGYKYAHDYQGNFAQQEYLPQELAGSRFYTPGENARENDTRKLLHARWGEKYGY